MTAVPFSRAPSSTSPSPTASRLCSGPNPASPMASDNSQHSVPVLSTASGFQVLPGYFQPSEAGSTSPAQVRLHEGSSLLADDPSASDSPSSALCSRAPNSMPPARVRLHGGSSLLADDPSASDRSPRPWTAPPRPRLPLGLGLLPSASDCSPRRSAPDCSPRRSDSPPSASDPPRPRTAPLGLGSRQLQLPAWANSNMQPFKVFMFMEVGAILLFHAAIQNVHVYGSGGHYPPISM